MAKKSESSVRAARVAKKEFRTKPDHEIDFSDIPELIDEQLKGMRRVGRPRLGSRIRLLISIRIDFDVLEEFRKEAKRIHIGYQTLINDVLARHVRKNVACEAAPPRRRSRD